jgi:hypothetical protein
MFFITQKDTLMNFERIKAHFKRNQKVYVACGTTAVVVGVGVYIWKARNPVTIPRTGSVTVSDSATITSSIFNTGTMHVNVDLDMRGHPGYIVECVETGKYFASQSQAAKALGVTASRMSKHLNGFSDNVGGFHFVRHGLNANVSDEFLDVLQNLNTAN